MKTLRFLFVIASFAVLASTSMAQTTPTVSATVVIDATHSAVGPQRNRTGSDAVKLTMTITGPTGSWTSAYPSNSAGILMTTENTTYAPNGDVIKTYTSATNTLTHQGSVAGTASYTAGIIVYGLPPVPQPGPYTVASATQTKACQ
jgi:hypothetical protein